MSEEGEVQESESLQSYRSAEFREEKEKEGAREEEKVESGELLRRLREEYLRRLRADLEKVENKQETIQFLRKCLCEQAVDREHFYSLRRRNKGARQVEHFENLFRTMELGFE